MFAYVLHFWQKIGKHSCKKEREKQNARERVFMKRDKDRERERKRLLNVCICFAFLAEKLRRRFIGIISGEKELIYVSLFK